MITSDTFEKIGVRMEKQFYLEDVANALEEQEAKIRLIAVQIETKEDRDRMGNLADELERLVDRIFNFMHEK